MPFKYRYFACVIFAVFGIASATDDHKINVTIFYESLDPASGKFFKDNFQSTNTSDLLKFIDVHLIPFGNTKVIKAPDGVAKIICPLGDVECYGNRVHACATKLIPKSEDQINFIVCTMQNTDSKITTLEVYPLRQCFEPLNNNPTLNRTVLEMCATAKNDQQFIETFAQVTKDALGTDVHKVPAIIFGKDQYDANLSNTYVKNFHDALCQRLTNTTGISAICPNVTPEIPTTTVPPVVTTPTKENGSATINSVTYLPLVLAVIVFFNLKLH